MLRILLFLIAVLVPATVHAQCAGPSIYGAMSDQDRAELIARAAATPFGSGNVWQATKGTTTLWVVGTMHLPDPRHGDTLAQVQALLTQSDLLLVEATLDDQAAMQVYMSENPDLLTMTDASLPDILDDATWASIRDAAAARGIPGFMAAKMQPWFLALTLAMPPCVMAEMATGAGGLDTLLMTAAAQANVPVQPLEPWQDMLALLTAGTFEEQIEALKIASSEPWVQDALTVSLIDFYFAGESAKAWFMSDYILEYMPEIDPQDYADMMAELEAELLIKRNHNWIPVIETAARNHDKVFVAFGAAHLIGDQGVLNLLQQNGWTLTRQ